MRFQCGQNLCKNVNLAMFSAALVTYNTDIFLLCDACLRKYNTIQWSKECILLQQTLNVNTSRYQHKEALPRT